MRSLLRKLFVPYQRRSSAQGKHDQHNKCRREQCSQESKRQGEGAMHNGGLVQCAVCRENFLQATVEAAETREYLRVEVSWL